MIAVVLVAAAAALWLKSQGGAGSGAGAVAPYPPPYASDVAARVLAAHAKDAAGAGGQAEGFVAEVAAMEAAEDHGQGDAMDKARTVARSAPKVRTNLGPDGWRGLTSLLAIRAVDRVEKEPSGAFFMNVLQPTGVVDAAGGGIGEGWQALAQVLHRVRILRLALSSQDDPEDIPLSDDEKRLYYRWKIERAVKSQRTVRLRVLRRLLLIEPGYPAADAEKHIIRGRLATGDGG